MNIGIALSDMDVTFSVYKQGRFYDHKLSGGFIKNGNIQSIGLISQELNGFLNEIGIFERGNDLIALVCPSDMDFVQSEIIAHEFRKYGLEVARYISKGIAVGLYIYSIENEEFCEKFIYMDFNKRGMVYANLLELEDGVVEELEHRNSIVNYNQEKVIFRKDFLEDLEEHSNIIYTNNKNIDFDVSDGLRKKVLPDYAFSRGAALQVARLMGEEGFIAFPLEIFPNAIYISINDSVPIKLVCENRTIPTVEKKYWKIVNDHIKVCLYIGDEKAWWNKKILEETIKVSDFKTDKEIEIVIDIRSNKFIELSLDSKRMCVDIEKLKNEAQKSREEVSVKEAERFLDIKKNMISREIEKDFIDIKKRKISRKEILFQNIKSRQDYSEDSELVDYKNIYLPIGYAKASGDIKDFIITICDKDNNKFDFRVKDGNICECDMKNILTAIEYEVN